MMPNVERVFAKSKAATRTSLSGAAWTHDGRYSVALAWLMGVLLVFMVVPEGLDYTARAVIVSTGSTLSRLIWISLLAVSFVVVIGRLRFVRIAVGAVNPFLLLFIVIVAASAAWSIEPAVTVRRLVRMFTIVLCCFAFTLMAWHPRRFQNVLRSVLTGMLVASLVFCVVRPDLAIEQSTQPELIGAWHGIATQKNGFGALSSMGMIVWLHARLTRQVSLIAVLFGLGVSAACLTLSRSSTAMVTAAFVAVLLFLLLGMPTRMRRFLPYMTVTFVVLILTYSLAVLQLIPGLAIVLEPITMMTGKDLSFTGRTHIWAIMSEHIRQHPMLGIGYGAFWIGPLPTSPSFEFITRLNFYPTEAHNGYLEVLNELGAVGGVCLAGFIGARRRK